MAIWQYLSLAVPKNSIDNNYECIFKNNETEFLPGTTSLWQKFDGNINAIISELDQILPKADWSGETCLNWKGNSSNDEDNDACICLTNDTTQIEEFQFRIDLRKASNITHTLQSILGLCKRHNLILIDLKGEIFEPGLKDILKSIQKSNAMKFIADPIQYFEDLDSKK